MFLKKTAIYFETLILLALFLVIYRPIEFVISKTIKVFKTIHNTADFYSEHEIHFYQPQKAVEKYNELYAKQMEEVLPKFEDVNKDGNLH